MQECFNTVMILLCPDACFPALQDLAKRLLLGKSASNDSEKAMVSRLKTECGWQFTAKLEGMFKDMDFSEELQRQFEAAVASGESSGASTSGARVELSVYILTSSYWPTYPKTSIILPPSVR
jgi:hypothetical protein